jgi:hypothetical protein
MSIDNSQDFISLAGVYVDSPDGEATPTSFTRLFMMSLKG